jgi:hypothetical protein
VKICGALGECGQRITIMYAQQARGCCEWASAQQQREPKQGVSVTAKLGARATAADQKGRVGLDAQACPSGAKRAKSHASVLNEVVPQCE